MQQHCQFSDINNIIGNTDSLTIMIYNFDDDISYIPYILDITDVVVLAI